MSKPNAATGGKSSTAPRSRSTRTGADRRATARRRGRYGRSFGAYERGARARLRRFRRASALAIGSTGLLLVLFGVPGSARSQDTADVGAGTVVPDDGAAAPRAAVVEATGTLQELGGSLLELLPKLAIALGLLFGVALLATLLKSVLRRTLGDWERASALSALSTVILWMLALGAALSVVAGDATALVGFVGFFGLALSWALQAPIESFSGWLLNSFRGYYRVGDRIEVGGVFGDVARIDVLTTTVWEAGGPDKPVQAAQPTGALVTFPNSEVLRANVVNYTRDFPYVWDEVSFGVSNRSDLSYAVEVLSRVAASVVGEIMTIPVETYRLQLLRSRLDYDVSPVPQVFASPAESYTNLTVRYLVPARERRIWASRLVLAVSDELLRPEHGGRIRDGYPRRQIEMVDAAPAPTADGKQA